MHTKPHRVCEDGAEVGDVGEAVGAVGAAVGAVADTQCRLLLSGAKWERQLA